jgi:hypothetical protein
MADVKLKSLLAAVLWVTITFGAIQTANAQQKPEWLTKYPANPLYYIGVAGIEKENTNDTEYQSKARELALSQLISQIEVNVSSVTKTMEEELDGDYSSSFSSLVELQAQRTIEDYEVVDTWESGAEYWVYLRLSKQQYQQRLQEKIELATEQAYETYKSALENQQAQNTGSALSLLVKALGDISPYIDQMPAVEHQGAEINLFSELRSEIQSNVDQIQFGETSGPEMVRIGQPADQPFSVEVVDQEKEKAMDGVPVSFQFMRGDGELENTVFTNASGVAKAQLSKLLAEDKLQIVTAKIDLIQYLSEDVSNEFLSNLMNSFNAPETRFVFKVSGRPVYLDMSESYLGEDKETEYFQPVLKNIFTERSFVFTDDLSEAELYLELKVNAQKGSETQGFYSVFLDYQITATNLSTGEEIASYSMADVKGVSITYEKAAATAYETALDSLQANMIPKLFEQLHKK